MFRFGDRDLPFSLNKVDRSKLYGFKDVEAVADDGRRCDLATLADDGRTVVGRGGTGIGQLTPDGLWCEKKSLKPVGVDGNPLVPVPSSFQAPIPLSTTVTVEQYLEHTIRLVYHLAAEGAADESAGLTMELKKGTIFTFPYSYRGGLAADAGFLMLGDGDAPFLLVGNPTKVEFIGLQEIGVPADEEAEEEESDDMDFDMI